MDNTTLHTFLFHCPIALRSLVLLGSWDNFSRPYSLELDARRGRNHWQGCFTFSDIICDGDLDITTLKRDGPLKMGGTYWYYYKVDGDDECHNPSEPSTTFCPLLPGQRLNVLELPTELPNELPTEEHCRGKSDPSNGFTRNPSDRYLNPVPPAPPRPLPSPHVRTASSPPSPWAPRSATYPQSNALLCPNVVRHARSASASPHMPSAPLFADLRSLKDKLASKRPGSRSRSSSRSRGIEIGSPVLISTTVEDLNLLPLASYRPAPTSAPRDTLPSAITATRSVLTIRKEFSPLGSHPVNPCHDDKFANPIPTERRASLGCRRSRVPSTIITSESKLDQSRVRANSADTRRTQHYLFSNDPWLSSPKLQQSLEDIQPLPPLQRPSASLTPPSASERPTSSRGSSRTSSPREALLDKELPPLPRYLTPAPLFACNGPAPVELPADEQQEQEALQDNDDDSVLDDLIMQYQEDKPASHFSTWSNESMAYSYPSPDDDATASPTFSSLDSDCSDAGWQQRISLRYSYIDSKAASEHGCTTLEDDVSSQEGDEDEEEEESTGFLSATPPRLDDVRISTFGSDLFTLDIQHVDSAPRRQAACFGLGFQYSLPDDDTTSKTTITESSLHPEPNVKRDSSLSQLNGLINDFAYLGEAVI